jgi:competence protein ComEC
MTLFSLAFLCGILLLKNFSHLPSSYWVPGILFFIVTISYFFKKNFKYFKLFFACALGFAWVLCYVHLQLLWVLPTNLEEKPIKITGTIAAIPHIDSQRAAFLFSLNKIQSEDSVETAHGLVHLSWHNNKQKLHVGDQWLFAVRLKKIHGLMNPGGFDNEAWSLQEGIIANGYVIEKAAAVKLSGHWYYHPIDRIRQFFRDKIAENLAHSHTSLWITALAIGERYGVPQKEWQVLRNTGTNHLMAIAGLHIGFMAAFVYKIVAWIWRRLPKLVLKMPAQQAGAIAALIIAIIYSAMAGFSIPTQRACLMLAIFLVTLLLRRKILSWHTWSMALLGVLLLNPLCVLTESFWLSFSSIALIIYTMRGRLAPTGFWWKHGRIQGVIAIGLIPLSVWFFKEFSVVSFIANSIAIPWVGFLVVPLTLLGCFLLLFSAKMGGIVLYLADRILGLLWLILTYLSHFSWASWYQVVPSIWFIISFLIGLIILLLPVGFPGRWLGVIWLLPLLLYKSPVPKLGDAWFTLLDVGQGLSAVVQTQSHLLIFDAGPRLSENFDMGESVVIPFLRSQGITHVDRLVVSHGDNDHIGGAYAILKNMPVYIIKTSVPERFPNTLASYCLRGERWQWDQVQFEFLYPSVDKLGLDNDSSCVLRITAAQKRILLTGDIEKISEQYLVNFSALDLAADILIAPHHGSKTSALDEFIKAVDPKVVLFPVGYRNRYHLPNLCVLKKYQNLGVDYYDTVHDGAIQFQLTKTSSPVKLVPTLYRVYYNHFWNN